MTVAVDAHITKKIIIISSRKDFINIIFKFNNKHKMGIIRIKIIRSTKFFIF